MKTTRQRLLEFLQTHPGSTSVELSRALQFGPADIRYHLGELVKDGLIEVVGSRSQNGRGRPAPLYRLSERRDVDSLADLTGALLDMGGTRGDQARNQEFLHRVAERLAGDDLIEGEPKPGLTARLLHTAGRLNELGYQAHWEARAGSPRVILARCPYAEILADHPELCRMDAILLEKLLTTPVKQTARLKRQAGGRTVCIFEVGKA